MTHQVIKNKRAGRRVSRRHAKDMKGTYLDPLGGEDSHTKDYSVESKNVKRFVGEKWMRQAEANNVGQRTPIVIVHITNERFHNDIVMMRKYEFDRLKELEE